MSLSGSFDALRLITTKKAAPNTAHATTTERKYIHDRSAPNTTGSK
jgi:hypothetical protein